MNTERSRLWPRATLGAGLVLVGVVLLWVTGFFSSAKSAQLKVDVGLVGEEASATVWLDSSAQAARVVGGRLGPSEYILEGDMILVPAGLVGVTLPGVAWVSVPKSRIPALEPLTVENLKDLLERDTKECHLVESADLVSLARLLVLQHRLDIQFQSCGRGVFAGPAADGASILAVNHDGQRSAWELPDVSTVYEAGSGSDGDAQLTEEVAGLFDERA